MKTWIKRTLIASATVTLLLGGLVACGAHHHRGPWDETRITEMRGKAVERIAGKLELDATQKAGLERVAHAMLAQRRALMGAGATEPRADVGATGCLPQRSTHRLEHAVSLAMTMHIVDALEIVEIDIGQRQGRPLAPRERQTVRELLAERPGVQHAGQRVGPGEPSLHRQPRAQSAQQPRADHQDAQPNERVPDRNRRVTVGEACRQIGGEPGAAGQDRHH